MKSQSDNKYQKDWEHKSRQSTKRRVSEAWSDERKYRKEFVNPLILGYRITAGKNCPHAKPYDGSTFLIEDVYDEPDLLPPYEGCEYDTCECEYTRVMTDDGGTARIVLEFGNPELQAKLITRNTSAVGFERTSFGGKARAIRAKNRIKSVGCTSVVLAGVALLSLFAGLTLIMI